MYGHYIDAIVDAYKGKKEVGELPLRLRRPTPGKLKRECLTVCEERFQRRDESMLRTFFGPGADQTAWTRAIKACDIDQFRPLVSFLKGDIGRTDDKNIELLAWLIDFEPRPYSKEDWKQVKSEKPFKNEEKAAVGGDRGSDDRVEGGIEPGDPTSPGLPDSKSDPLFMQASSRTTRRIVVTVALSMIVSVTIGYCWSQHDKTDQAVYSGPQGCMYWAGDHYERVSCNTKFVDTLVIALDSNTLVHFRRILRPDTITEGSMGKVWYAKYNGDVEFYTGDGDRPIDPRSRLHPITPYMIRKYCHP